MSRKKKGTALERRDAEVVFSAWVESTGRTSRTVLDPKRRRLIDNAYKLGFDTRDLTDAVDGWRFSSFHRGENDRQTVYNDLSLILRDAEHIERFIAYARGELNGTGRLQRLHQQALQQEAGT